MKQKLLRHIIITALLLISISSFGQQEPLFTQYMNNPLLINPAYAGSQGNMNFNGIFRKQWAGDLEWTPTTSSLSINSPFLDYKVGVGLNFIHDATGPITQTSIFTDYAYHLEFDNGAKLSLGLKGGFNFYQEALAGLRIHEYDGMLARNSTTFKPLFNVGVGAYYFTDTYFIGASIPRLIRNSITEADNTYEIIGRQERHLYMTGGYVFDINTLFKFKPTVMLRTVNGSPYSAEITATAIFVDQVWFGLMYRVGAAYAFHARVEVTDGFQIGYSFDLTTTDLNRYSNGSHEIYFSYTIKKQGKRILSPRYF